MAKHDKHQPKASRSKGRVGKLPSAAVDAVGSIADAVNDSIAKASGSTTHEGGHVAAKPHGRPARVDETLPATRDELLARHAEARRRRAQAPLGSDAYREAVDEIGRIEIRIAAIEEDQVATPG